MNKIIIEELISSYQNQIEKLEKKVYIINSMGEEKCDCWQQYMRGKIYIMRKIVIELVYIIGEWEARNV